MLKYISTRLRTTIAFLICIGDMAGSFAFLPQKCNITFDRNLIHVHFNPYVLYSDPYFYDEAGLMPMIRKISSRFNKIEMPSIYDLQTSILNMDYSSIAHIPNAVARFNLDQSTSSTNTNLIKQIPNIIELTMTFHIDINSKKSTFDIVKKLADDANKIFNGTVTSISLWIDFPDITNIKLIEKHLNRGRGIITQSVWSYQFGLNVNILVCEGSRTEVNDYFKKLLPILNYVYFDLIPTSDELYLGIETTVPIYIRRIQTCTQKMKSLQFNLTIGFRLSWQDTSASGNQNISNFVNFWIKMSTFANISNTTLVLSEAFDIPHFDPPFNTQGWWRLKTTSIENPDDYIFEEKCSVVTNIIPVTILQSKNVDTTPNPNTSTANVTTEQHTKVTLIPVLFKTSPKLKDDRMKTWSIRIGASTTVVVCILVTILYLYRRLKRNEIEYLTEDEVTVFFQGQSNISMKNHDPINITDTFAYDNEIEILSDSFSIDKSVTLGAGEFGTVSLATVDKGPNTLTTAVKISKLNSAVSLKSLMCEIKVLTYLGEHGNIVKLIGAYTGELQKGSLYVFLELCALGSLQKYLRNCNGGKSSDQNDSSRYQNAPNLNLTNGVQDKHLIDKLSMRRWCHEIATGMEYLAGKNLVHGDLATRNILLDENKKAKLCDFGLSRRLYDNASYLKSHNEPLPWRWMSPESLRRLEFNEKTDIWAFGVTMWEIYSLGDIPYPGLSWSADFSTKLEGGLRLLQPSLCAENLYSIMSRCWNICPDSRPSFSQLIHQFSTT